MPKIPVYEQQVRLATGSLGPRASSADFEAPGRAMAALGEQVSNLANQFGMAEKEAETERFSNEAKTFANQEFNNFTNTSEATTVPDYQENAKSFAETLRQQKIEPLRDKLTTRQFRTVEAEFNKTVAAKIATGSQKAFTKHQAVRSTQVDQTVEDTMSQMRGLSPNSGLYQGLQKNLDDGFDRWAAQGLSIKHNKGSYRRELSASAFEVQLNGASSQQNIDDMRSTLEEERGDMSAQQYAARTTAINAQEKVVDDIEVNAVYDQIVNESQDTFLDKAQMDENSPDSAVSKIRRGDVLELKNNAGEMITVDFNAMKPRNRDFLIQKIKARHNSDKSATLSANLNSIDAQVQDMNLADLRSMEGQVTKKENGAFVIAPDIKDFNDRQVIKRLINAEIAERAKTVIASAVNAERELVAQIAAANGVMTDEMTTSAAQISTNLRNAEKFQAADKFDLEIASSAAASAAFKGIEFTSAAKEKAVLEEKAKLRNTAQGQRTYELLVEKLGNRNKKIAADFVGYYQTKNPDSELTPNQLIEMQIKMGIAPLDARVTSNAELDAFKAKYDAAETYADKAAEMNTFLNSYGENQNRVMRHLTTTGQVSLAQNVAASDPANVNMKAVLAGNTKEGQDRIKTDVESSDRDAIREEVFTLVKDYTSSIIGGITDDVIGGGVSKGRASHVLEMRDIMLNTAGYIKVLFPDKSASEVANLAYDTVIGGKFVFGDINGSSVRIDKDYEALQEPIVDVLSASLKEDRDYLSTSIQYPPVPEARVQGMQLGTAEYDKAVQRFESEFLSDLMREGTWRTTTDNKGFYLVDQTGNVVRKAEGAADGDADPMAAFVTVPIAAAASLALEYQGMKTGTVLNKKRNTMKIRKLF